MIKVRTRNAPSPTGIPHIGNSRTALFDFLLAKKYGGDFVLRIEDTDQKRTVPGALEKIYEIHEFLGLVPDESPQKGGKFGPYIQTERLEIYKKYAKELIDKGAAYEDEGAIRIRMPKDGYTVWQDLIQGKISVPNKEVDDKVLMKSDGVPTYHLAAMVDDHLMEISHIIRGVEYIVSTPVHLKIYEALGWQFPQIAHVPLILGPDRTKLSKRHGAKSVLEYRDEGYLPEAINNFLLFLGFSYRDNSDILSLEEMIKIFDERKIQKQNAIFDLSKLNYFNRHWLKRLNPQELAERLFQTYHSDPVWKEHWPNNPKALLPYIPVTCERITTLKEALTFLSQFFDEPTGGYLEASGLEKDKFEQLLELAQKTLVAQENWKKADLETTLRELVQTEQLVAGEFFGVIRSALTASRVSPPLFDTLELLGKENSLSRLQSAHS